MQSLQTIAEQYLPAAWESDQSNVNNLHCNSEETCDGFDIAQIFKCQFCEETFKGVLRTEEFRCDLKMIISDEWSMGEHMKVHMGQTKYYCDLCSRSFVSMPSLSKHMESHSSGKNNKSNKERLQDCQFVCNVSIFFCFCSNRVCSLFNMIISFRFALKILPS